MYFSMSKLHGTQWGYFRVNILRIAQGFIPEICCIYGQEQNSVPHNSESGFGMDLEILLLGLFYHIFPTK